jgi:glycosyltransferase involved in cell wall biosynthesis
MPKLSICVTTYNRWSSCVTTLSSLVEQSYKQIEIILVDDCSTQAMPVHVEDFIKNNNIIYVRHKVNKGLAAARNTAIELSTGEFFSFCDDDDKWPTDLAIQLLETIQHAPSGVSIALALSGNRRCPSCLEIFNNYPKLSNVIRSGFTPPVGSQLYITSLLQKVGGYNIKVRSGVDHDLWISLAMFNPSVAVSWRGGADCSNDTMSNRLTTVEATRRKHIAESLLIWKPKIVDVFGENFYRHFCQSYKINMDYNFFVMNIRNRRFIKAILKLNLNIITVIFKKILDKSLGVQHCNNFPRFKE